MPEVQLSCGESVTVTAKCEPCESVLLNDEFEGSVKLLGVEVLLPCA